MIDPILMCRFGIDELLHVLGEFLQFLVDLLNALVGDVPVELLLTRGRPPQYLLALMRQKKG